MDYLKELEQRITQLELTTVVQKTRIEALTKTLKEQAKLIDPKIVKKVGDFYDKELTKRLNVNFSTVRVSDADFDKFLKSLTR